MTKQDDHICHECGRQRPTERAVITLRMDRVTHESLKKCAYDANESLNLFCIGILEKAILTRAIQKSDADF